MEINNHFSEIKVFTDLYEYDHNGSTCRYILDTYTITCCPDGSVEVSRKFDRYDEGGNFYPEYDLGAGNSTFTGTYKILEDNSEFLRVNFILTKETTKTNNKDYQNKDVHYTFDLIENKLRKRKGLSNNNNIFWCFLDYQDDETFYKYEIDTLSILGLTNEEIIEGMARLDKNVNQFLLEKFTQYKLKENLAWIKKKKNNNYTCDYRIQELLIALVLAEGDKFKAIENIDSLFKEICLIFEQNGITDKDHIYEFVYNNDLNWIYGPAQSYYEFYNRKVLYKDQNEEMKKIYCCNDDEENYKQLVLNRGSIRDAVYDINRDNVYNKELLRLKAEGFTDEEKNSESIKNLSKDFTYEDLYCILKVNYDDKLLQDFNKMKEFRVDCCKKSFDVYMQNNQDWAITALKLDYPEFLEIFGNSVQAEKLLHAIGLKYFGIEDFASIVEGKINFFKDKGVTITEGEVIKLLAYKDSRYAEDEKVFKLNENFDLYLQKNEEIKMKFPYLKNDYKNMKALYCSEGNIKNALYDCLEVEKKFVYADEIKTLKEMP